MAIEDADATETASATPITVESSCPSERSRSDKRGNTSKVSQVAVVPPNDASRFSHRGFEFHASREGLPTDSNHVQPANAEFHVHETNVQNNLSINQTQNNELHMNMHDPAITQMVEQIAEARHKESMANTEGMVNMMVTEMNRRFEAEEQQASNRMHQLMMLAERREGQFREELTQQGEEYKRVLDGNARQSNATKDLQMSALRTHYEKQDEARRFQMSQMEIIIQQQSEQIKAQQLQTESMNMQMKKLMECMRPFADPIVQTASMTLPPQTEVKLSAQLGEVASGSAQKINKPDESNLSKPPGSWDMIDALPTFSPVEDNGSQITGLRSPTLPPTSVAASDTGNRNNQLGGNGPPDGEGPDDEGDDKPGQRGNGGKKLPRGSKRPPGGGPGDGDGGGDDDGDDDHDEDEDDRNFIRRMRVLFGNPTSHDSDMSKVKEADTIKVPAFPHAESYRNWRIRTREAVMSASTNPDKAFDWISETWTEGQTIDALRDVGKFTTLDAKLLSALTNILTGDLLGR